MENLIIGIINTSLFLFLVLINIFLCFAFGNYFIKKVIPSNSDQQSFNSKDFNIIVLLGFIIICNLLSFVNFFLKLTI